MRTCRSDWRLGGTQGGTQVALPGSYPATPDCQAAVQRECPAANGVTFLHYTKECWCNFNMAGFSTNLMMKSCWFVEEPRASGSSQHAQQQGTHHGGTGNSNSGSGHGAGSQGQNPAATSMRACRNGGFQKGRANEAYGSRQTKLTATYTDSLSCHIAVQEHCPNANGATYSDLGECWCNNNTLAIVYDSMLRTCWFEDVNGLWNLGGLTPDSIPVWMVPASTFAAAAVAGTVVGSLVLRRHAAATRSASQQVLVEEGCAEE